MNFKQSLLLPSTGHTFMVSFLLGITASLLFAIGRSLAIAEDAQRRQLAAVIFFQANAADAETQKVADSLRSRDAGIVSVQYLSKQAALENAQQDPAFARSLVILKENPLPASVTIRYHDSVWLERSEPGEALRGIPEIQEIRWDPEARTSFRSLHEWRTWVQELSLFIGVLLGVWALSGIVRLVRQGFSSGSLSVTLGVGLFGGTFAMVFWALAAKRLGIDAALFRGPLWSPCPLGAGLLAALASAGLQARRE